MISYPDKKQIESSTKFQLGDSTTLKLSKVLVYSVGGGHYKVPKGFLTDGASIPTWSLVLMSWYHGHQTDRFSDGWLAAAILHDYQRRSKIVSDRVADAVFFDILKETTDSLTAWVMWAAVRLSSLWLGLKAKVTSLWR